MTKENAKASRLETLGAWLHLWTPPRDCEVPPVPWGKVAAGAVALLAAGALVALVVAPAIDDAKQESAAEERAAEERRRAERRARVMAEQRARTGRLPAASRGRALAFVEAAIGRDARERFDTDGAPAACDPAPGVDAAQPRVAYECFATVREIVGAGDQEGVRGALSIPYRAVLEFEARRYAFCKTNPPPAEQAIPDPRTVIELPPACRR